MHQNLQQNLHNRHSETMMIQTPYSRFLKRHQNKNNCRLHFIGWMLACLVIIQAIFTLDLSNALYALPFIVVFTFCGHYFCEGDMMSLEDPIGSIKGQFQMFKDIITRKRQF